MTLSTPFSPGALIISCQARSDNPFNGPGPMTLMARAAALGGAAGIRANGPRDIAAIHAAVDLPIIGINKQTNPSDVYITPTVEAADEVVEAGASLVAIDGTQRPRPDGSILSDQIVKIHNEVGVAVMADVDCLSTAEAACAAGADLLASTLAGYTASTRGGNEGPDISLVAALADRFECPIVAEGRYWTPVDVATAFDAGAYAVVVGTAVTNPIEITRRLKNPANSQTQ